jgi:hypothetical protein
MKNVLLEASQTKSHEEVHAERDVRRKQSDMTFIHARDLMKELASAGNIMAYTRFYKNHTQPNTQHWKDLMEIMEQAVLIREGDEPS